MSRQPGDLIIREYKDHDKFEIKFLDENDNFEWRPVENDHLVSTLTNEERICRYCSEQLGVENCNTKLGSVYQCIRHFKKLEIDKNEVLIRKYEKKTRKNGKKDAGSKKKPKKGKKQKRSESDGDLEEEPNWTLNVNRELRREPNTEKLKKRIKFGPEPVKKSPVREQTPEEEDRRQTRSMARARPRSRGKAIFEDTPPTPRALRSGKRLGDLQPATSTPTSTPPLLQFTPQAPFQLQNSYYNLSNASQVSPGRLQALINELSLSQLNRSLQNLSSINLTPDRQLDAQSPTAARRLFEDTENLQTELPSFSDSFIRRQILYDPEDEIDLEFWTNVNVLRLERQRPESRRRTEANRSGGEQEDADREHRATERDSPLEEDERNVGEEIREDQSDRRPSTVAGDRPRKRKRQGDTERSKKKRSKKE